VGTAKVRPFVVASEIVMGVPPLVERALARFGHGYST